MAFRNRLNCFICGIDFLRNQMMSRLDGDDNANKREIAINRREQFERPPLAVTDLTRICINCNQSIHREIAEMERDPSCLRINVLTQTASRTCMICNADANVYRLTLECRVQVFISQDVYIPENVRSCEHHLDDRGFLLEALLPGLRSINRPYVIKGPQLQMFLQGLRNAVRHQRRFMDENSFTDAEFESFCPMTKQQFLLLYQYCDRVPCPGGYRYVSKKDLLMFLCKMRQGLSDDFLAVIFEYSSRQASSLAISTVRQSLMQRFVPTYIGLGAITREDYIQRHVNDFANELYNSEPNTPRVIMYIDGTYSYIPKSNHFRSLRQSYCYHKGRHLVKPILLVAPDGYILDIHGPYFSDSRNNDAAILRNEFDRDANRMREWLQEGDILILDRGYRDVTQLLTRLGIRWKMPALLAPGQRQLPIYEANESRLITKTRWIVEARNGHIKSIFKFLQNTISITHLPNLGDFYRIAGAIINRFHPSIQIEGANAELARQLLEDANKVNVVQALVEAERLNTRDAQRWVRLNAEHVPDFPILDLDYLRDITVGIYQVRLAPSYIQDKLQREESEELQLEMMRDAERIPQPGLLRVRVYSRFRNAGKYQLWISYRPRDDNDMDDGMDFDNNPLVQGYYCTCKSGARTVGTCAHIASILWFIGFARHEPVRYPATRLLHDIRDAANRQPQEDDIVNM